MDTFAMLAEYRLNNLREQAERDRIRRQARGPVDHPLFHVFADMAYAGFVEDTAPGRRQVAGPATQPTEAPQRQPDGGLWALLHRVIGGLTRTETRTPGVTD